jgi:hypothetical protein
MFISAEALILAFLIAIVIYEMASFLSGSSVESDSDDKYPKRFKLNNARYLLLKRILSNALNFY